MEHDDVPQDMIDEYAKTEILRKSLAVVQAHSKKMNDIRKSPTRYDRVTGKVNTNNTYSSRAKSMRRTMGEETGFNM